MKKLYTLIILCATVSYLHAQNIKINLANGESVTYTTDEISSIEFNAEPEEVLFHEFTGWLSVSTAYFQDTYYGDSAVVRVYTKGDGYVCRFHDGVWGDGRFDITLSRGQISGTGTLNMDNHRGGTTEYEATISGPMTAITISIPSVMGGTNILWTYGAAPTAKKIAGTYNGTNFVNVGGVYDYTAESVRQTITANSDGSINLTISSYDIPGTVMGDITIGSYSISNIAYSEDKGGFYKEYADGVTSVHFKAVNAQGTTTFDNDYLFNNNSATSSILIKQTGNVVSFDNTFSIGSMPFPITTTMNGVKGGTTR